MAYKFVLFDDIIFGFNIKIKILSGFALLSNQIKLGREVHTANRSKIIQTSE